MRGFPERVVDGHAGAVGHGPLALHGPAVGFPRGQQVLESLQKEGGRCGEAGQALWFPSSPRVLSVCLTFAKPLPSLDLPFFIRWQTEALNQGAPGPERGQSFWRVASLAKSCFTHLSARGLMPPHSFPHRAEIRFLGILVPAISLTCKAVEFLQSVCPRLDDSLEPPMAPSQTPPSPQATGPALSTSPLGAWRPCCLCLRCPAHQRGQRLDHRLAQGSWSFPRLPDRRMGEGEKKPLSGHPENQSRAET